MSYHIIKIETDPASEDTDQDPYPAAVDLPFLAIYSSVGYAVDPALAAVSSDPPAEVESVEISSIPSSRGVIACSVL